jgi:hypothetical protein
VIPGEAPFTGASVGSVGPFAVVVPVVVGAVTPVVGGELVVEGLPELALALDPVAAVWPLT